MTREEIDIELTRVKTELQDLAAEKRRLAFELENARKRTAELMELRGDLLYQKSMATE